MGPTIMVIILALLVLKTAHHVQTSQANAKRARIPLLLVKEYVDVSHNSIWARSVHWSNNALTVPLIVTPAVHQTGTANVVLVLTINIMGNAYVPRHWSFLKVIALQKQPVVKIKYGMKQLTNANHAPQINLNLKIVATAYHVLKIARAVFL